MKPSNKSRSTVTQGMNMSTRCHSKAKGKASYSRKGKYGRVME